MQPSSVLFSGRASGAIGAVLLSACGATLWLLHDRLGSSAVGLGGLASVGGGALGLLLAFALAARETRSLRLVIDERGRSLQQRTAEAAEAKRALDGRVEELRRAQDHFLLSDRQSILETLASGLAHEINNPLCCVVSNLEFVSGELRGSEQVTSGQSGEQHQRAALSVALPPLLEALADAEEAAQRVNKIVRSLRIFSSAEPVAGRAVDLRSVLESTITMARPEIRNRARLEEKLTEVPRVRATEMQLGQVFLNLLLNAAQAIRGPADKNKVIVRLRPERGGALVEVEDTGTGIAEEHLPRIFDPFFTTKPLGAGTGLGLSIVQGIVRSLHGTVQVRTQSGTGTCFSVWLPADPTLTPPARPVVPSPAPSGKPRVLVIDDEPAVCTALGRLLSGEHEVSTLTDPQAALARLLAGERFDAVLCDLMMPQLSGPELFQKVEQEAKDAAGSFVFITGGAVSPEAQAFLSRLRSEERAALAGAPRPGLAIRVLHKPVALADLRQAIRARVRA